MKYLTRKYKKMRKRITRTSEGDENRLAYGYRDPYKISDDTLGRKLTLLSRGGELERSHNKKVGNVVNRDLNRSLITNDVLAKYIKRINDLHLAKKKKKRIGG